MPDHTGFPAASPPLPGRIKAARELRGLTQRQVVERMGADAISAPALSQIESGKLRPSEATIPVLAEALEVPSSFFRVQLPAPRARITYFRDLRSTTARERRRAAARALLLNDLVAAFEQHVRGPDVDVPDHPILPGANRAAIERAATSVRRAWDLGEEPIPHVVLELERHGVVVARLTTGGTTIDAFSTWLGLRPLVLLTDHKQYNYVRSRFDASHELGHLVMHPGAKPGTKELENQAHTFASSFLLPDKHARAQLPSRLNAAGWSRLAEMKRVWGISMAALLQRARHLAIISTEAHQSAMRLMSARGWRTQEPGDREMGAPEAPRLLERLEKRATQTAEMPIAQLVRDAYLPLEDTLELLRAAKDARPSID